LRGPFQHAASGGNNGLPRQLGTSLDHARLKGTGPERHQPIGAGTLGGNFTGPQHAPASQAERFGYNCDYVAFMPLPKGSTNSDHGLLCVNNEYISPNVMFPGTTGDDAGKAMTGEQVDLGMAAMGHSIAEVMLKDGKWSIVADSPLNRRITANTEMLISGPAAGHALMKTSADQTGTKVLGTSYNCSGGVTPWGTVLTCEEGVSDIFGGDPKATPIADILERYGFDGSASYGRAASTIASTSPRNRTSPTASTGWSRSILTTRPPSR
jgi:hypothetical protein